MDEAVVVGSRNDGDENQPSVGDQELRNNDGTTEEKTEDAKHRTLTCHDCGMTFSHLGDFKNHLYQHVVEEESDITRRQSMIPEASPVLDPASDGNEAGDLVDTANESETNSSSLPNPSATTEDANFARPSLANRNGKIYTCSICGKVYSYLVSFTKHQMAHGSPPLSKKRPLQVTKTYECPDCGLSFIRRTRLLAHLRVHVSPVPVKPKAKEKVSQSYKCRQCNKRFPLKAWLFHIEIHKRKPFWCLSCARGYRDEQSLDRHLQNHTRMPYKCDLCYKRFYRKEELINHNNLHTGLKPFCCTHCGKSFAHPASLVAHKNKHTGVYVESSGMPLETAKTEKKPATKKRKLIFSNIDNESNVMTCPKQLLMDDKSVMKSKIENVYNDVAFGDKADSEESDCGEPAHIISASHALNEANSPIVLKSIIEQTQMLQELNGSTAQKTKMHRVHKYCEWECYECDMGFDEIEELHSHYIKHATGELPMLQDDTDE